MSLTLNLPSTSLAMNRPVSQVVVNPMPLASILDHHLRRGQGQDRVFGTLLGVRREGDNEVEVRNAFGVPYATQGKGEVTVDMDHHKSLLDLHLKVNPKEVVVGW
jgi:translation initiation factor 3 subunit F